MHNFNTIMSKYVKKEDARAITSDELEAYLDMLGFDTDYDVNISFVEGGMLFVGVAK